MATIELKVFRVSSNTNSFGLYGHWLMDRVGRFWTVGFGQYHKKKMGDVVVVPVENGEPRFETLCGEIPERQVPDAPPAVVIEVWGGLVPYLTQWLWDKACEEAGVDRASKFVVFDYKDPWAKMLNHCTTELFNLQTPREGEE